MGPISSMLGAAVLSLSLSLSLSLTALALPAASSAQDAAATPGDTPAGLGVAECTVDPV